MGRGFFCCEAPTAVEDAAASEAALGATAGESEGERTESWIATYSLRIIVGTRDARRENTFQN